MMFVWTEWNTCRGGLFDMLYVVWVGRTCMICHHMRTEAPFCILTPLRKGGRLLVWCLFSMFWVGEWYTTISDSRYRVSAYWFPLNELWNSWTNVEYDATVYWGHWSVWFRFDPRSVFESSKADFVGISNSSPIFREHCALPCCCALSFSTVNMLSGRFYSPHHLIFVTRLSRYFLILFCLYPSIKNFKWNKHKCTFGGQKGENKTSEPKNTILYEVCKTVFGIFLGHLTRLKTENLEMTKTSQL
jgi:hypothetical protein